jgi:tRNA uridine 5-carbamoylmethylation protein Kti12
MAVVAGSILLLTGPPGAGKTTVAGLVARARTKAVHLVGDVFHRSIELVDPEPIATMYEQFRRLGSYERNVLDTAGESPEETATRVLEAWAAETGWAP